MSGRDARFLVSGVVMLAVAMGVGRFAYTPLLPLMEHDAGLTVSTAGLLASANLFGYFLGALGALHAYAQRHRLTILRWSLAGIVATTALMAGGSELWLILRFLTGLCSGFVLVFASSIVLERAARAQRPSWPPLFFSGVGVGIAFSGIAVPILAPHGGSRITWIGIGTISAIALAITAAWFTDEAPTQTITASVQDESAPRHRSIFLWLLAVYTAEAFAYVIPATFLVTIITHIAQLAPYASLSWVVAGVAGSLAMFAWTPLAKHLGKPRTLALAFLIQALGIAAPVFSQSAWSVTFSALTLGGTFMAITFLAVAIGRDLYPTSTTTATSRLTVFYSIGQIIGPLVATHLALQSGSYDSALLVAAGLAAAGAVVTFARV